MEPDSDEDSAITSSTALTVIEEQAEATIRRALHDGRMFFSVIDVIAVLTDSTYPNRYWSDLKRKLHAEGATQPYERIVRLKLRAPVTVSGPWSGGPSGASAGRAHARNCSQPLWCWGHSDHPVS